MKRAERQHVRLECRRCFCQCGNTRHVADAAVAGMAQPVNLGRNSPNSLAGRNVRDCHASRRRHGKDGSLATDLDAVVTRLDDGIEPQAAGSASRRQFAGFAVFIGDVDATGILLQRQIDRFARGPGQKRRQRRRFEKLLAASKFVGRAAGQVQRGENSFQGIDRHDVRLTRIVLPFRCDAGATGQITNRCVVDHDPSTASVE